MNPNTYRKINYDKFEFRLVCNLANCVDIMEVLFSFDEERKYLSNILKMGKKNTKLIKDTKWNFVFSSSSRPDDIAGFFEDI